MSQILCAKLLSSAIIAGWPFSNVLHQFWLPETSSKVAFGSKILWKSNHCVIIKGKSAVVRLKCTSFFSFLTDSDLWFSDRIFLFGFYSWWLLLWQLIKFCIFSTSSSDFFFSFLERIYLKAFTIFIQMIVFSFFQGWPVLSLPHLSLQSSVLISRWLGTEPFMETRRRLSVCHTTPCSETIPLPAQHLEIGPRYQNAKVSVRIRENHYNCAVPIFGNYWKFRYLYYVFLLNKLFRSKMPFPIKTRQWICELSSKRSTLLQG